MAARGCVHFHLVQLKGTFCWMNIIIRSSNRIGVNVWFSIIHNAVHFSAVKELEKTHDVVE